ncbi:MAG TPA: T9SS type A sorting domain-containing protein [Chryseosolibacter sp.]
MKHFVLLATFILATETCQGQEVRLKKQSLSASGFGMSSATSMIVSQTIAQPSLINAFSNGKIILLQGFEHYKGQSERAAPTDDGLLLYPNPTRGRISIKHLPLSEHVTLELYDLKGVLTTQRVISHDVVSDAQADFSEIASGTYTLVIRTPDRTIRKILIIL